MFEIYDWDAWITNFLLSVTSSLKSSVLTVLEKQDNEPVMDSYL